MEGSHIQHQIPEESSLELVPRMIGQGYDRMYIDRRREWVEEKTGCRLFHVGCYSIHGEQMRGNVENPIGAVQVPLGLAGPLLVRGEHARGIFYVPMATTEGALLRSYERGMVALTRAGGVSSRVQLDANSISPVFTFKDITEAHDFSVNLHHEIENIRREAESTTRHGKLLRIECQVTGRQAIVTFYYTTADASGMNMIVNATERACKWI